MPDAPKRGEDDRTPGRSFEPTLCFPGDGKTCFACCPPIRPAGYDHLDHRLIIRRMLRENTAALGKKGTGFSPITGFSCWALGYLDRECRLVGCLLHPARNDGMDLRFRTGYGEKCSREICPEARRFGCLDPEAKIFWLHLADGLDAFEYSSRKTNPLFRLMGWGPVVLNAVAAAEKGRVFSRRAFFRAHPFFSVPVAPRAGAYLADRAVAAAGPGILNAPSFPERFTRLWKELSGRFKGTPAPPDAPYTHRLDLSPSFLDFLRLGAGIRRIDRERAYALKKTADRIMDRFVEDGGGPSRRADSSSSGEVVESRDIGRTPCAVF